MINYFFSLSPIYQALIASLLTFLMTTLGALCVIGFKNINKNIMDYCLAISAGIMLSAAIFSLLLPSITQSNELHMNTKLVVSISILAGSLLLIFGDKFSNKYILKDTTRLNKVSLFITSIILHNIPEGLAIGVAFGSIVYNIDGASVMSAISLAIGIGIQNFPEGASVSIPLRRLGYSRKKAFLIGTMSGIVEPIAAIIGCILAIKITYILPYMLAFASGAMIFVIAKELIPESMENKNKNLITCLILSGFVLMMILEI